MRSYNGKIQDDPNFHVLFENLVLKVGHVYEASYCVNKLTGEEIPVFTFDNDPTCAIAGQYNDWCLVGGDLLVLRTLLDNTIWGLNSARDSGLYAVNRRKRTNEAKTHLSFESDF